MGIGLSLLVQNGFFWGGRNQIILKSSKKNVLRIFKGISKYFEIFKLKNVLRILGGNVEEILRKFAGNLESPGGVTMI